MKAKPTLTAAEARHREYRDMPESELQRQCIDLAHLHGWFVAHFRPGKTSREYVNRKGEVKDVWVTPVEADGAGWPDLVLAKGGHLIFAELKSTRGRLTPAEKGWLRLLATIPCADTCIWRPIHLEDGTIENMLR